MGTLGGMVENYTNQNRDRGFEEGPESDKDG